MEPRPRDTAPSWLVKLAVAVLRQAVIDVTSPRTDPSARAGARNFLETSRDFDFWAATLDVDSTRLRALCQARLSGLCVVRRRRP